MWGSDLRKRDFGDQLKVAVALVYESTCSCDVSVEGSSVLQRRIDSWNVGYLLVCWLVGLYSAPLLGSTMCVASS
jgi:hypothetical protein